MNLVLFQPEIPQNVGTLIRFAACMGISLDIIEPCGFLFTDKYLKRAAMDYQDFATIERFVCWEDFCKRRQKGRRIAVTSKVLQPYVKFSFEPTDLLIIGQESQGLPPSITTECHESITIPMVPERRSLNMALAAAIVTTEALRQTRQLPGGSHGD